MKSQYYIQQYRKNADKIMIVSLNLFIASYHKKYPDSQAQPLFCVELSGYFFSMDSEDSPPATPHPVHAAWSYSATHLNLWSRYAIDSRHQNRSLLSLRSNPPNEYEQANLWIEKAPAVPHRKGKSYCIRRICFGAAKASPFPFHTGYFGL